MDLTCKLQKTVLRQSTKGTGGLTQNPSNNAGRSLRRGRPGRWRASWRGDWPHMPSCAPRTPTAHTAAAARLASPLTRCALRSLSCWEGIASAAEQQQQAHAYACCCQPTLPLLRAAPLPGGPQYLASAIPVLAIQVCDQKRCHGPHAGHFGHASQMWCQCGAAPKT